MDEPVPQAAAVRTADEDALEALRLDWGEAYAIGREGKYGWWAARTWTDWALITARTPDGLRAAMAEDYKPQLGEAAPDGR